MNNAKAWRFAVRVAIDLVVVAVVGTLAEAGTPLEQETIDQPPAKEAARDNLLARSPGMRVVTGPYVSVQVNVDALGRNIVGDAANEPSIAVNPLNRSNMVIGWRQFDSVTSDFRQAGWAYSFNRGASWTFPGVLTPGIFRSDPVLDVDATGVFYYLSLLSGSIGSNLFKSFDGGVTWSDQLSCFGGDKNWLAVDRTNGPGNGFVYIIWHPSSSCCGYDVLTRSTNGGDEFDYPVPVQGWPTFGTLAVGPTGMLYAVGIDGTDGEDLLRYSFARSKNGPDAGRPVDMLGSLLGLDGWMIYRAQPNPIGLLGQANVVTDQSDGSTRGNVYVLASVRPSGILLDEPQDVHFVRSTDGGRTFSAPVRVNDDPLGNWQWLAATAVAPNGRIDAMWYDTRDSHLSNVSRLYFAYSWDAGATWSANRAVSPPFDSLVGFPNNRKMGDYITLVSDATGADAAYTATFNGEQDVYYVRLFPDCNGNGISDVADIAGHASFDCNLNHVPDECETSVACIGAGSVPDGGSVPGSPLTIARGAGDAITLSWGASCVAADADYAVYEGSIGSFASHAPRACSTGGALSFGFVPDAGDSYYLIVPVHADREGSYGTDNTGAERPPGTGSCAPQTLHACGS